MAVARVARRHYAIEHVDTTRDGLYDVLGLADAHQVARLVLRQLRADGFQRLLAFVEQSERGIIL
ncbi:hypothetical protein D3C83_63690 [compost metagenome]